MNTICELLKKAEQQGIGVANSMNDLYISMGEIDCPEEILDDIHVKLSDIKVWGKSNWIKSLTTGKYSQVDDYTLESLYDMGKITTNDIDEQSDEDWRLYYKLSKEERVEYRISNQGISLDQAKEIVDFELGL